jgi:uncharacterized protein YeaO (DUF488 family)
MLGTETQKGRPGVGSRMQRPVASRRPIPALNAGRTIAGAVSKPPGGQSATVERRLQTGVIVAKENPVVARIGDPSLGGRYRVLVDRLWPRGIRKAAAPWDEWLPGVAPSTELRRWYGHDPTHYETFRVRYLEELEQHRADPAVQRLQALVASRPLALLTFSKQLEWSHAPILAAFLATLAAPDMHPDHGTHP